MDGDMRIPRVSRHDIRRFGPGEWIATTATLLLVKPFAQAYATALGRKLGENASRAVERLSIYDFGHSIAKPEGETHYPRALLRPDLPDAAQSALGALDLADPTYHDRLLQWDEEKRAWKPVPVEAESAVIEANNERIQASGRYSSRPWVGLVALLSLGVGGTSGLTAYGQAVGEHFATDTVSGLRRFYLSIRRRGASEPLPLTLIVDPELPSAAIEALIDLQDDRDEELAGLTMRWDPEAGQWQEVEADV